MIHQKAPHKSSSSAWIYSIHIVYEYYLQNSRRFLRCLSCSIFPVDIDILYEFPNFICIAAKKTKIAIFTLCKQISIFCTLQADFNIFHLPLGNLCLCGSQSFKNISLARWRSNSSYQITNRCPMTRVWMHLPDCLLFAELQLPGK